MLEIRRILVAVKDPARRSPSAALRKAVQLAKASNARVEAFHALASPIQLEVAILQNLSLKQYQREQRMHATRQLERMIAPLARSSGIEISVAADTDSPKYEATIRHALKIGADLIVADVHDGRHTASWRMQLTDWELLRHSPLPVLLVKSTRAYAKPKILAAIDPSHAHAKTDKLDQDLLSAGSALRDALKGSLYAMHAYVPLPAGLRPAELRARGIELELQDFTEMAAKRRFDEALLTTDIPASRRILSTEHPDASIPQISAKMGCRIVVMGAVSRSGLKRFFFGNTAERVLDALRCDVLIVKQKPFKSGVQRAHRGAGIVAAPVSMGF